MKLIKMPAQYSSLSRGPGPYLWCAAIPLLIVLSLWPFLQNFVFLLLFALFFLEKSSRLIRANAATHAWLSLFCSLFRVILHLVSAAILHGAYASMDSAALIRAAEMAERLDEFARLPLYLFFGSLLLSLYFSLRHFRLPLPGIECLTERMLRRFPE